MDSSTGANSSIIFYFFAGFVTSMYPEARRFSAAIPTLPVKHDFLAFGFGRFSLNLVFVEKCLTTDILSFTKPLSLGAWLLKSSRMTFRLSSKLV